MEKKLIAPEKIFDTGAHIFGKEKAKWADILSSKPHTMIPKAEIDFYFGMKRSISTSSFLYVSQKKKKMILKLLPKAT